jgi:hypothetical protein
MTATFLPVLYCSRCGQDRPHSATTVDDWPWRCEACGRIRGGVW